jgi:hypothetical protein
VCSPALAGRRALDPLLASTTRAPSLLPAADDPAAASSIDTAAMRSASSLTRCVDSMVAKAVAAAAALEAETTLIEEAVRLEGAAACVDALGSVLPVARVLERPLSCAEFASPLLAAAAAAQLALWTDQCVR